MLKVGITGGIGSGKTTVCQIMEKLGVPVYYADRRAKELMEDDKQLATAIRREFGEGVYTNGVLNSKYLADIVFNDETKLVKLNDLVHPAVFADSSSWNDILARKGFAYTLRESALLVESGSYRLLDKIIVVSAPEEDRIKRVIERDGSTAEQVMARICAQMPDEQKVKYADYIIINDNIMDLVPQVTKIHIDLMNIN